MRERNAAVVQEAARVGDLFLQIEDVATRLPTLRNYVESVAHWVVNPRGGPDSLRRLDHFFRYCAVESS